MPEALLSEPCAAAESPIMRGLRYAAGALLVLIALVEFGIASVMASLQPAAPQFLYLLCTLALLVSVIVALRERRRAIAAARGCAIASAVTLFWSCTSAPQTSFVAYHGKVHDMIPSLAGMLLAAVLLPALVKEQASEAACNCQ